MASEVCVIYLLGGPRFRDPVQRSGGLKGMCLFERRRRVIVANIFVKYTRPTGIDVVVVSKQFVANSWYLRSRERWIDVRDAPSPPVVCLCSDDHAAACRQVVSEVVMMMARRCHQMFNDLFFRGKSRDDARTEVERVTDAVSR